MRLPSQPTQALTDHVNTTYFYRTWNAPDNHVHITMSLSRVNKRVQTGTVPVGLSVVGLPTTDAVYGVYRANAGPILYKLPLQDGVWYTDAEVVELFGITFNLYATDGRPCPPGSVYVTYIKDRSAVLFAISTVYLKACTGVIYPQLGMEMYRDTTRSTPLVTKLFVVQSTGTTQTASVVNQTITTMVSACPHGTTVAVNGWIYDPSHVPTLAVGNVVSIVSDPDVVGYCDIPIDDNLTGYDSTLYEEYREILHIPKALNPQNVIITSDTLSVLIFDTQTHKGVFVHRMDDHAIEAITHNDFSIARSTVDAFSTTLEAQNVTARVYVRFADQRTLLTDDIYHLHDFYSLDDATIKAMLIGQASPQLGEWTASALEQSPFLSLLSNFDGVTPTALIPTYTSAMGYYDVAAVLGQQMRYYTYANARALVTKPVRLFGYPCNAIVYCNGRKVLENAVAINNFSDRQFSIGFTSQAGVEKGDRIAVYITEDDYRTPLVFNPTSGSPSITLDNDDYTLVEIFTYNTLQKVWKGSTLKGYKPLVYNTAEYTVTQTLDGTYRYEARAKNYGKHYYLVPKYGMICASYNLHVPIFAKSPVVFSVQFKDENDVLVPLVAYNSHEVYCNGYRLTEDLDYTLTQRLGTNGDVLQTLFVLTSYDHLDLSENPTNVLEIVVHGDEVKSQDKGYLIENAFYRSAVPMLYAPSSSRAFVGGVLQETLSENGETVTFPDALDNGAPVLMEYNLAYGAGKLLRDISDHNDINLQGRLEHVLGLVPHEYPDVVVVEHLLALYSPFLAQIVTDVGNGVLFVVDEARNDAFLKQFSAYKMLLEVDPIIGDNNPLIDRRFVTLAAHYTNWVVTDPEQMVRVQRLISLVLTPSELSIKEVLL